MNSGEEVRSKSNPDELRDGTRDQDSQASDDSAVVALEDSIIRKLLDGPVPARRQRLHFVGERHSFSLWGFLKSVVGRDLTRVTMPIHFNEPLSFTQRLVEDLEYSNLLNDAAECMDSMDCLARIAAFASSPFGSAVDRHYKPFNPILGETFDAIRPEDGYCVVVEQVCHHPPVTAMHCQGKNWKLWQEYKLETRFRGNSIKVIPTGTVHLSMGKHQYSWNKPHTTIHNIMIGRLWLEHEGEVLVRNHTSSEQASVSFQSYKSIGQNFKQLRGAVKDSSGDVQIVLEGNWMEGMQCYRVGQKSQVKSLWKSIPRPANSSKMFGYTMLGIQLNEFPSPYPEEVICYSDSRFRPDERLYEECRVEEAAREKARLEDKQRAAKKQRDHEGKTWEPKWFAQETNPYTKTSSHVYKGGYWVAKQRNEFVDIPDLF